MISSTADTGNNSVIAKYTLRVYQVTELEGQSAYYIATRKGDANGQYGKHIPISTAGVHASEIIVGGGQGSEKVRPNDAGVGAQHHQHERNDDCDRYDEIFLDEALDKSLARNYIELVNNQYGTNVISLSQYTKGLEQDPDQYKNGVWVYVDQDAINDGATNQSYVYWSNALTNKLQDDKIERTYTTEILDQLNLHHKPEDGFDYFLHVDMEAVSYDELNLWSELPKVLEEQFGREERGEHIPERPNVWPEVEIVEAEVDISLEQAGVVVPNGSVLEAGTYDIKTSLKSSSNKDFEVFNAEVKDRNSFSLIDTEGIKIEGKTLIVDETAPRGTKIILSIASGLRPSINKKIQFETKGPEFETNGNGNYEFGGYEWQVLYDAAKNRDTKDKDGNYVNEMIGLERDSNAKLIGTTRTLEEKDFDSENNVTKDRLGDFTMYRLPEKGTNFDDSQYSGSNQKVIMDSFFDKMANNSTDEKYISNVLPVEIKDELFSITGGSASITSANVDYVAKVSQNGDKIAFTLGVSDINYLGFNTVAKMRVRLVMVTPDIIGYDLQERVREAQ